ncbi:MAG: glutamate 5-kinase [Coriobacteriales bacterium]|jgi:glutamate 5-kinase|nr:glutamate 5-kinase [Coriobacteriales bacterium]
MSREKENKAQAEQSVQQAQGDQQAQGELAQNVQQAQRIVVKIGTSTLTDEAGRVNAAYIESLASQVAQLCKQGTEVAIVSSGAITAGLEALNLPPARPDDIPTLQAAAAVGQVELAKHYAHAFEAQKLKTAQVLLTRNDIANREAYLHARDTLSRLLELGVVAIINENDTVAVEEIRFGDNDTLAAQVAILIGADLVILLSDIDGLYTADPRTEKDAELIEHIASFTEEIVAAAGSAGSHKGSGGMVTKLEAARQLMAAGIPMVICEGRLEGVVAEVASGALVGTRFASEQPAQAKARKLWNALSGSVKGSVIVDEGATCALREQGSSLLPVGVTKVDGSFAQGDVLDIRSASGFLIGRGISQHDAATLEQMAGHTSEELSNLALIGDAERCEVIHRDEMVIF